MPCYKICTIDPLDEIVPLFASLPVNAAKLAYQTSMKNDEDQFKSPHDLSSVLESLMLLFDFDNILHGALQAKAAQQISSFL